ncbi:phosphoribosyltransferase [Agromyces endophyticus]|uniref:phosphoribosyltransferase n=1 Tax=Agromyces sp. H17E-10 TaxID=2932244 RepID=UPI001FD57F0B|nr:phosphoribosyltransferase family protein [Agromyces sp. H17E-10]UOQ88607.1 phosphoribosyltransferase [Agromyces sp. H17E-10]
MEHFANRVEAGERLAARLLDDSRAATGLVLHAPVVLGLPRGGVPVAAPVAESLDAPLDVLVVRKLGTPGRPELAMGAIGEEGALVRNDDVIAMSRVDRRTFDEVRDRERVELDARVARFRGGVPPVPLAGRHVVIVDDGIATGATMRVACRVARARGAARIVVATPVAAPDSLAELQGSPDVDAIVCLSTPPEFMAVGMHYLDFAQTSDDEVVRLLAERRRR